MQALQGLGADQRADFAAGPDIAPRTIGCFPDTPCPYAVTAALPVVTLGQSTRQDPAELAHPRLAVPAATVHPPRSWFSAVTNISPGMRRLPRIRLFARLLPRRSARGGKSAGHAGFRCGATSGFIRR